MKGVLIGLAFVLLTACSFSHKTAAVSPTPRDCDDKFMAGLVSETPVKGFYDCLAPVMQDKATTLGVGSDEDEAALVGRVNKIAFIADSCGPTREYDATTNVKFFEQYPKDAELAKGVANHTVYGVFTNKSDGKVIGLGSRESSTCSDLKV